MTIAMSQNIGAYLKSEAVLPPGASAVLSSDGATETVGRVIDRLALGRRYESVKLVVNYQGTITSAGLSATARFLGATASGGTFAPVNTVSTSTGITRNTALGSTATATSTSHSGTLEWDFDLRTAPRYIQFGIFVRGNASSSGSGGWGAVGIFGGADELPPVAPVDRATTS